MKRRALLTAFILLAMHPMPNAVAAQESAPQESVAPQASRAMSNVPGKTFTSVVVTFPPRAKALPHRHGDAFVYAYVLEGSVRSQIDDEPARVYRRGQDWFEAPRARHRLTENTSKDHVAKLLVTFVADSGAPLKTPDQP